MAINKLALMRYKVIDECLRNRFRKWTLEDIIEVVSEALYEYENIKTGVSKRTIQADIQMMRSDKLGYNAPIVVEEKKYYRYADKNYSIMNAPINAQEIEKLQEILTLLKQFTSFQYFNQMSETVLKLENHLYKTRKNHRSLIHFESNHELKGIAFIQPLYQAILQQKVVQIEYQSFKAKESQQHIYFPYLLKEYRNRWFLIANAKGITGLVTRALDRIIAIQILENEEFIPCENVNFETYYDDLIGVTKTEQDQPQEVTLYINPENAPYVLTKPMHSSQKLLVQNQDNSIVISLKVILNFELEREILGFGNGIKVLAPEVLVHNIRKKLRGLYEMYQP